MKVLINIGDEIYRHAKDGSEDSNDEWNAMRAIANGTPIPDNATNGDAVKAVFSDTLDNFCERTTWEWNRWWNAPYQKGGKE